MLEEITHHFFLLLRKCRCNIQIADRIYLASRYELKMIVQKKSKGEQQENFEKSHKIIFGF